MAAYERTHPWLTFSLDLRSPPPKFWLALGEAQSKCEHLAGVPLPPGVAKELHQVFLAKGVHATTAIEGNTLSERDVLATIKGTLELPKSQSYLKQEIDNILKAVADVEACAQRSGRTEITSDQIKAMNKTILEGLEVKQYVVPGELRKVAVGVLDYAAPAWEECPSLVQRFCEWMNQTDLNHPADDSEISRGIIKSIVAHVYFAWIHPFGDGNGRTARLLEVRFLMEAGVPSSAIHLLSNHYNITRSEYYRQLSAASKNGGNLDDFMLYAVRGLVDLLKQQIQIVRQTQWGISWQNFIYEIFGDEKSPSDKRQIRLLLDLSKRDGFVSKKEIRELSTKLAIAYAGKTEKTLNRDINALEEKGLIERDRKGVRARKEIILAFLPRQRGDEAMMEQVVFSDESGQLRFDFDPFIS